MEMINRFVAIDLETTGLRCNGDKITEIALIRYENGIETASFSTLVNPGVHIEDRIVELTGINDEMVKDAPYISELVDRVEEFLEQDILVGHSLMFDYSFLKKAMVNSGRKFEREGIDTLKLSRTLLPELEHKNLEFLCEYFGIADSEHHRAANDARAAATLLLKLNDMYGDREPGLFTPKKLEFKVKKEGPITKRQIIKLKELVEKHNLQIDYEIEKLTKNEASRKIDKIYLQFGRL